MKKMNNKGFSLVELIIVIAIMAILIGVLAPQYMKYVDRSRVSADKDVLDAVYGACTTAFADPDLSTTAPVPVAGQWTAVTIQSNAAGDWASEVLNTLGAAQISDVDAKLKSNAMKGKTMTVEVDGNGNFRVYVQGATDPGAVAANATFTDYCVPQQY